MINKNSRNGILFTAVIIMVMTIAMRSTNNMVITTLPLLSKIDLGFSKFFVGIISALLYLFTFSATFYINPRLSASPRRFLFIISNIVITVLLVLYFLANYIIIWPVSALAGFSYGMLMPNLITSASLINDQKTRERLISLYSVGLSLSLIIGPVFEDYILSITSNNYRLVFLYFVPIAVAGLIASIWIKFPETKHENRKRAFKNRSLKISILTITTYNVPFAALSIFLTLFAISRFHISGALAYSPYIYFFAVSFITRSFMTVRPFNSIKSPLLISIIITAAALAAFPFLPNFLSFILVMMLLGIPHGSVFPLSTIIISRGSSLEERSAVNSYFMAYNNILFMIIPLVFGYIVGIIGYSVSFFLLIIPVIVSSVALYWKYSNDEIFSYSSSNRSRVRKNASKIIYK